MAPVPGQDGLSAPTSTDDGEGQLRGGQGHQRQGGHPDRRGHPCPPRKGQQHGERRTQQVGPAVAQIDPRRRPVEDQEGHQRGTERHGQLPARPVEDHGERRRGDPRHPGGQHVQSVHEIHSVDE